MKVLITGASGFLGGHLVQRFLEQGHSVRAFVRKTSRTDRLEKLGVELVRGDLKDADSLRRAVEGVEVVVHAASTMAGVPEEYVAATIEGTRSLLSAAEEAGVRRFVYVSSIAVYPMRKLRPGQAVTEDCGYEEDPLFLTNYTKSKIGADRAALECAARGKMEVFVLRPGLLYGPRGPWSLPRMGYPLGKNWYLVIGRGRTLLPVCYVGNCAEAILMAAETKAATGGAFTVVDDELFTQNEYLRRLKADARPGLKVLHMPYAVARALGSASDLLLRPLGRPSPIRAAHLVQCTRRVSYSNARLKDRLGWKPRTGKEEALARTMASLSDSERLSRRADVALLRRPPSSDRRLRTCLIGCGVIAQEHLKTLLKMKNAAVVGLCDVNGVAARELAGRFDVPKTYADPAEMLDAEKPDVVHVLTPPQSHLQLVELAAEHGCNALVEKPMALDAAEGRRMAEACAQRGVALCVDHNHLYDRAMVRARALFESGAIGEVVWVDSYYGFNLGENLASRYMLPGGEKHWTFGLPGGLYQNLAPHPLSVALDLLGAPASIRAFAEPSRILPHQPTDELRIMLECGRAGGVVTVSLAASPRQQYITVYGSRMTVHVDFLGKRTVAEGTMKGVPKAVARALMDLRHAATLIRSTLGGAVGVVTGRWTPYEGMDLLIREFYSSLIEGRQPPVTPDEAIRTMDVMDAVWRQIGPLTAREVQD